MHKTKLATVVGVCLASVLTVTSCGGGGSASDSAGGSPAPTPTPSPVPSPAPTPSGPKASEAEAARYLDQASFGPSETAIAQVVNSGIPAAIDAQLAAAATGYTDFTYIDPNSNNGCPSGSVNTCFRDNYSVFPVQTQFFRNAISGPDQLRQRVAFALSQIFVVSGSDVNQTYAMAAYQQLLLDGAFGSYRALLENITLSPAMGDFLDMANNDKANAARGSSPNENYAREVLQLFALGPVLLNPDGSSKTDAQGQPLPAYGQTEIMGVAAALTGWTYAPRPGASSKWVNPRNYEGRMVAFETHHEPAGKTIINGQVLPAGQTAAVDLQQTLNAIANHPNVGPFIGKQLIQFLVTANPSPAFVARISAVFDNDGSGVRGNLGAVVKAILLDSEARGDRKTAADYGRLREPVALLAGLVRGIGGSSQSDGVYLRTQASSMGEAVYAAPSVFNFYPPDYPISGSQLVAPVLGIYDSTTTVNRVNFFNALLNANIARDASVANSTGTSLDLASWRATATDANALADRINKVFFYGAMSSSVRNTLVQTVNGVPASDTTTRARAALYLALTSHPYQVQQ